MNTKKYKWKKGTIDKESENLGGKAQETELQSRMNTDHKKKFLDKFNQPKLNSISPPKFKPAPDLCPPRGPKFNRKNTLPLTPSENPMLGYRSPNRSPTNQRLPYIER